jgi:hypothetical protein
LRAYDEGLDGPRRGRKDSALDAVVVGSELLDAKGVVELQDANETFGATSAARLDTAGDGVAANCYKLQARHGVADPRNDRPCVDTGDRGFAADAS